MTGKEVVSLIQKLEEEGLTAEKIIEIIKYVETAEPKTETELCMTGKEIANLIRSLRADGMSDTKILDLIEYIETHDPKENENNDHEAR